MALTKDKRGQFALKDQAIARTAKALSHPARIEILRLLATNGACICGEVVEGLPYAQSTVSQHIKALHDADLVIGSIEGASSCYCVNWVELEKFQKEFTSLFLKFKDQFAKCC